VSAAALNRSGPPSRPRARRRRGLASLDRSIHHHLVGGLTLRALSRRRLNCAPCGCC